MSEENSVSIELKVTDNNATNTIENLGKKATTTASALDTLYATLKRVENITVRFDTSSIDPSMSKIQQTLAQARGQIEKPMKMSVDMEAFKGIETAINNLSGKIDGLGKAFSNSVTEGSKKATSVIQQASNEQVAIVEKAAERMKSSLLDISRKEIMVSLNINTKLAEDKIIELSRNISKELQKGIAEAGHNNQSLNKMATDRPMVATTRASDGVNYAEWQKQLQGYLDVERQVKEHYNKLGEIHVKYMNEEKARQDKQLADQRAYNTAHEEAISIDMNRELAAWRAQRQTLKEIDAAILADKIAHTHAMTAAMSQSSTYVPPRLNPNSPMTSQMGSVNVQNQTRFSDSARMEAEIRRQEADNLAYRQQQLIAQSRQTGSSNQTSVINELSNSLNKLQQTLMMVGVAMSGRQIMEYADQWTHFTNAVGIATEKTGNAAGMQERLFKLAVDARAPLDSITTLYLRMSRAAESLNMSQGDTVNMIDTVTKSLAIMGTSPNAVRGGLLQLEQALGGVTVRGQEFKSILDSMPNVMGIVVKHYDEAAKAINLEEAALRGATAAELEAIKNSPSHIKTIADLRNAMYDGKITSEAFAKAILMGQAEIQATFERTHKTFAQGFTELETYFTKFVGRMNEGSHASDLFFKSMVSIGEHMDLLVSGVTALGAALITVALNSERAAAGMALMSRSPVGLAVGALAGSAMYAYSKTQEQEARKTELTKLREHQSDLLEQLTKYENAVEGIEKRTGRGGGSLYSKVTPMSSKEAEKQYLGGKTKEDILNDLKQVDEARKTLSVNEAESLEAKAKANSRNKFEEETAQLTKAANDVISQQTVKTNELSTATERLSKIEKLRNDMLEAVSTQKGVSKEVKDKLGVKGTEEYFTNLATKLPANVNADIQAAAVKKIDEQIALETKIKSEKELASLKESIANKIEPDKAALGAFIEKFNSEVELQNIKNPVKLSVELNKESAFKAVNQYNDLIKEKASKYGVDPNLMQSIIGRESGGDKLNEAPYVKGVPQGQGLAQFTPDTQKSFGITDWKDPVQQIDAQARYLVKALEKTGGDVEKAIILYHNGLYANVDKVLANKKDFPATIKYVKDVLSDFSPATKTTQVASQERLAVESKIGALQSAFVERDNALKSNDIERIKSSQQRVGLLKDELGYTNQQLVKSYEVNQARITANTKWADEQDKIFKASYDNEQRYQNLLNRRENKLDFKQIMIDNGEAGSVLIDNIIKESIEKEKSLTLSQGILTTELLRIDALRKTAQTDELKVSLNTEYDNKLKEIYGTEESITAEKRKQVDASNADLQATLQYQQAALSLKEKLTAARSTSIFGGMFGGKSDLQKQVEAQAIAEGVISRATGEITNKEKYAQIKLDVTELIDLEAVNRAFGNIQDTIGSSFTTLFQDIVLNGKSATDALGDMFKSLMNKITSSILEFIAQGLVRKMFSGFGDFDTGGLFGGLGGTVTAIAGAVAVGTYMGLQKHGNSIQPTVSQTSKYENGIPADAQLMLSVDKSIGDMAFLQSSKFAANYNESLKNVLSGAFTVVRTNATQLGEIIGTTVNKYFPGLMSGIKDIGSSMSNVFTSTKEVIGKFTSWFTQTSTTATNSIGTAATTLTDKISSAITPTFQVGSTGATTSATATTASTGTSSLSGILSNAMTVIGYAVSVVSTGYQLYSVWSDKNLKTMDKIVETGYALSDGMLSIGLMNIWNPVGWGLMIAAAVTNVVSAVSSIITDGFSARNISRLLFGVFGGLIQPLFEKQKKFDLGMYGGSFATKTPGTVTEVSDKFYQNPDWKGRAGDWTTNMGSVHYGRTQGLDYALTKDEINYAKMIADVLQGVGNVLNKIDISFGLATDTSASKFRKGASILTRTDADSFDSASMADVLFTRVVNRLSKVDTESAKKTAGWLQTFIDAYPKEYTTSVISLLTQPKDGKAIIESLVKLPEGYMEYINKQLKTLVKKGKSQNEITKDVADMFAGATSVLEMAQLELVKLKLLSEGDYKGTVKLLSAFDDLGISMVQSSKAVLAFATVVNDSFKGIIHMTAMDMIAAKRDYFETVSTEWTTFLKTRNTRDDLLGVNKKKPNQLDSSFELTSAALSLQTLLMQMKPAGAYNAETYTGKPLEINLSSIGGLIDVATKKQAGEQGLYKPVEDANKAYIKALQTNKGVGSAKTALDDAYTEYESKREALTKKVGAEMLNNLLFVQSLFLTTTEDIAAGMSNGQLVENANSFVEALGGIDKAMQTADKALRFGLGEQGFLQWKKDVATSRVESSLTQVGKTRDNVVADMLKEPVGAYKAALMSTVALMSDEQDAIDALNKAIDSLSDGLYKFESALAKLVTVQQDGSWAVATEFEKRKVGYRDNLENVGYGKLSEDAKKVLSAGSLTDLATNAGVLQLKKDLGIVDKEGLITSKALLEVKRQQVLNDAQEFVLVSNKRKELADSLLQASMTEGEKATFAFNAQIETLNGMFGAGTDAANEFIASQLAIVTATAKTSSDLAHAKAVLDLSNQTGTDEQKYRNAIDSAIKGVTDVFGTVEKPTVGYTSEQVSTKISDATNPIVADAKATREAYDIKHKYALDSLIIDGKLTTASQKRLLDNQAEIAVLAKLHDADTTYVADKIAEQQAMEKSLFLTKMSELTNITLTASMTDAQKAAFDYQQQIKEINDNFAAIDPEKAKSLVAEFTKGVSTAAMKEFTASELAGSNALRDVRATTEQKTGYQKEAIVTDYTTRLSGKPGYSDAMVKTLIDQQLKLVDEQVAITREEYDAKNKLALDSLMINGKLTTEGQKRYLANQDVIAQEAKLHNASTTYVADLKAQQAAIEYSSYLIDLQAANQELFNVTATDSEKRLSGLQEKLKGIDDKFLQFDATTGLVIKSSQDYADKLKSIATEVYSAQESMMFNADIKSGGFEILSSTATEYEKRIIDIEKRKQDIILKYGNETVDGLEGSVLKSTVLIKQAIDIVTAASLASFLGDYKNATYEYQLSKATDANKQIITLEKQKQDIILKYGNETIDGLSGSVKKADALIALLVANVKAADFEKAKNAMLDFRRSIAEWVIGFNVSQLGSTKSQLDTAQAKLAYQMSALSSATGIGTMTTTGLDADSKAALEKYAAQIQIANSGKSVGDIKDAIRGSITSTADQTISAIKAFYGSSKEGNDLIKKVIDSVGVLPQQVDPQLRMVTLLEDIKRGIFVLPDSLKGTALGSTIEQSFSSLKVVLESALPADLKVATADAMANAIYNAVGLGLSSFSEAFKLQGTTALESTTAAILSIVASVQIPEDDKLALVKKLSESMADYSVIINAKIDIPDLNLDTDLTAYLTSLQTAMDNVNSLTGVSAIGDMSVAVAALTETLKTLPDSTTISVTTGDTSNITTLVEQLKSIPTSITTSINTDGLDVKKSTAITTAVNNLLENFKNAGTNIGTYTGISLTTALNTEISKLSSITLPAINTSSVITSISAITTAANSALAALQAMGAQQAQVPIAKTIGIDSVGRPVDSNGYIIENGTSTTKSGSFTIEALLNYKFPTLDVSKLQKNFPDFDWDTAKKNHPELTFFADGGSFTNGIVSKPTSFNMGLMGEAGSEAIMPLTNVNGKLGVHVVQSANDSNMNSEEELAELKRQNQILIAQNQILQEGFRQLINQNVMQNEHLDDISSTTRRQVNG